MFIVLYNMCICSLCTHIYTYIWREGAERQRERARERERERERERGREGGREGGRERERATGVGVFLVCVYTDPPAIGSKALSLKRPLL